MDENGAVPPKAATNEGDGNKVVDNCDARAEEGDAPDAEMKVTDTEKPINEEKVQDKSDTKAPSPFKAPPMAFKLPAALPKNPKLFEGNKNKPEPTKTLDSEKNDAKIAEEKEKVDKKATDVALGPKRKSAVAALTPAQKVLCRLKAIKINGNSKRWNN